MNRLTTEQYLQTVEIQSIRSTKSPCRTMDRFHNPLTLEDDAHSQSCRRVRTGDATAGVVQSIEEELNEVIRHLVQQLELCSFI